MHSWPLRGRARSLVRRPHGGLLASEKARLSVCSSLFLRFGTLPPPSSLGCFMVISPGAVKKQGWGWASRSVTQVGLLVTSVAQSHFTEGLGGGPGWGWWWWWHLAGEELRDPWAGVHLHVLHGRPPAPGWGWLVAPPAWSVLRFPAPSCPLSIPLSRVKLPRLVALAWTEA